MIRLPVSAALHFAANGIGLLVATLAPGDMSIDATALLLVVVVFTVVKVLAGPLLQRSHSRTHGRCWEASR